MGGLFKGPKPPKPAQPPEPPPPPVREDAEAVAENNANMLRRRRGRAASILTADAGDSASNPVTAAAQLLGQ